MQIMSGHINICMTDNRLDRFDRHAQRLKLRYICMAAAVWRQYADTIHSLQCFLKLSCKVRRVAGLICFSGRIPDKFIIRIPEKACAILCHGRHRDGAITVIGLGCTDGDTPLDSHQARSMVMVDPSFAMCPGSKPSNSCVRMPVESIRRILQPILSSGRFSSDTGLRQQ